MLANVSWSPEVNVALDTLQRSVFVSASGNAEQFSASVQCGYYHLGVLCLSNDRFPGYICP